MRMIAIIAAALSVLALGLNLGGGFAAIPVYVSIAGLVVAAIAFIAEGMRPFLRFFVMFYSASFIALMVVMLASGILPAAIAGLVPPPLTAFTAAAFVGLIFLMSRVPVIQQVARIADPYFSTEDRLSQPIPYLGPVVSREKIVAMTLLAAIILINLGQVAVSVQLSYWGRNWFDTIQNKNAPEFWRLLFSEWIPWVALLISSNLIEYVFEASFKMRWRAWMTDRLTRRWLEDGTHYRLNLIGNGVDNPDQRIQEDVNKYIQTTYSLSITLIQQISSLISFAVILWGLSASLTLPGTTTTVPGLLLWIAIAYAAVGTAATHFIGHRLIPLYFAQEKYEANFRFGLARLREFSEPIALLNGEQTERNRLGNLFGQLVENFFRIVHVRKWLNGFVQLYGSLNSVVPYVIVAPFYFAGSVTLGAMQQTAGAFSRVDSALSFFIDRYATLADYKAVVDRLNGFDASINTALDVKNASGISHAEATGTDLAIPRLDLALPNGTALAHVDNLVLASGLHTLITGPSGSGKSTIFRAIAAIWPFGKGQIDLPTGSVMVLPQRPYLPIGTLRSAVSYPDHKDSFTDEAIAVALDAVQLGHLKPRLDEVGHWTQVLSGGEQQRLGIARALLAKPDWLLMDESTSALDEPLEAHIYTTFRKLLPATTVVSIGHRSSLIPYHDARIDMTRQADGTFAPKPAPISASAKA